MVLGEEALTLWREVGGPGHEWGRMQGQLNAGPCAGFSLEFDIL